MRLPRIMLAAPASGSGKTLVTCGILQALVNRGYRVASFKCGPDYIDPMFHSHVIGTRSGNLDTFFTGRETTRYLFSQEAQQAEISVAEGVMGYYDGLGGISTEASSADVAKALDMPVVLVVNCRGLSLSVIPLIQGFVEYEHPRRIRGVILNQMSPSVYPDMKELIEMRLPVRVLGYVPRLPELAWESRHLGLVMPEEIKDLREKLGKLAGVLEKSLDLDALMAMAYEAPALEYTAPSLPGPVGRKKLRIALARDEAFCFTYRDNLRLLEELGAEFLEFSPLRDKELPKGCEGLILSGGYPELYAEQLSGNASMCRAVQKAVQGGLPCIAECGGFLYLHRSLEGEDGKSYPMAGVVDAHAYRTGKLSRFGYVMLKSLEDQMLLSKGGRIRGHEFHYWESGDSGGSMRAEKPLRQRNWSCVHGTLTLYAGFPHLFFYSKPQAAKNFLECCGGASCLR